MIQDRESVIPIDLGGGFTVSATTVNQPPRYAFDGNDATLYRSSISPRLPEYLTVLFPRYIKINGYSILSPTVNTWEFQGLINDVWTTYHTGEIIKGTNGEKHFYNFEPVSVKGIRIKCNTRFGDNSWHVSEVRAYAPMEMFLIENEQKIYTFDEQKSKIIESPSSIIEESNFKDNGFINPLVITEDIWNESFPDKSKVKLLMWTEDQESTDFDAIGEVNPKTSNQWLIDNKCKLLMWTDDIEKTEATMTYELKIPYKPIDILKKNNNGICNILMSKS